MVDFDCSAVTTNLCSGESSGRIVGGEGTDIGFLGGSTGEEPDGTGVTEESVGGGNAPDSQFGYEIGGDEEFFLFEGGGIGKEGCGVSVVTDTEEDEVEAGRVAELGAYPFFVFASTDFGCGDFGADSFNLHASTLEDFLDHAKVAILMIGIDPAFVAEVEAGGGPGPLEGG